MKIELDCTWNNQKNRAKQSIYFTHRPKSIFQIPSEKILYIQNFLQEAPLQGPSSIKEMQAMAEKFPQSLYVQWSLYKLLQFFGYTKEAQELFSMIKKKFLGEVFPTCIEAEIALKEKRYEDFPRFFREIQVLKGAFPRRRSFFFEEVLLFHNLWGRYFFETGDALQADKHRKIIFTLMEVFQNLPGKIGV